MKLYDDSLWADEIRVGDKIKFLYGQKIKIGKVVAIQEDTLVEYTVLCKNAEVHNIRNDNAVAIWKPRRANLVVGDSKVSFNFDYLKKERLDVVGKAIECFIRQLPKHLKGKQVEMTDEKARWSPLYFKTGMKYAPIKS